MFDMDFGESAVPSLSALLINLAVGVALSLVLRWHFRTFGSTLSNRDEFAQVFPFILLTTVLVITVVKSSLALSLGLVGALSIVRFRTPVKEPEELAYLFVAIAIGLGLTLIHLISIPVTNTSVNPARSTGVALYEDGWAVSQLWLFWVAPLVGGVLGAVIYRFLGSSEGEGA